MGVGAFGSWEAWGAATAVLAVAVVPAALPPSAGFVESVWVDVGEPGEAGVARTFEKTRTAASFGGTPLLTRRWNSLLTLTHRTHNKQ